MRVGSGGLNQLGPRRVRAVVPKLPRYAPGERERERKVRGLNEVARRNSERRGVRVTLPRVSIQGRPL